MPSITCFFGSSRGISYCFSLFTEYSLIICFEFLDTSIGQRVFYHLHQNLERNSCDVSASLRALDDVHRMSGGSTDNLGGNLRIIVKDLYDIVNQVCTVGGDVIQTT